MWTNWLQSVSPEDTSPLYSQVGGTIDQIILHPGRAKVVPSSVLALLASSSSFWHRAPALALLHDGG
ncbi:MAG: hypothetical protein J7463_18705 [Roseiflexus sp.]|jgi:hypothetical protein|nr:hypothetical protein [Roseiflexus sp.]MBO9333460.1 hypothetical protein [Roseiflexus sp.]MBO9365125.1 hypothetical protein [Roseiflexus sp.]MBO9382041.1 hypothetical protein [Roseiflexus sp.]MBO9387908.1 hypothetical protein [Roseiflexus sp.]